MRVRANFTLGIEPEQFREATGEELTKVEIRQRVQAMAETLTIMALGDMGVKVDEMGMNNVYDPNTRQTMHQDYIDV